ncbi:MAG: DMT family protein, partial [Phocaeicola sp.]
MLSHGIFSVLLLILSNIFMTFAWYGHLKMREYSWFESLPL